MKLAEALVMRADIQRKISEISTRLYNNAKVQEGDTPSEDPYELIEELNSNIQQLNFLIKSINYTNCVTVIDGVSLTDMIADKDTLTKKISVMRRFFDNASAKIERYSNKEIKIYSTVDVAKFQKELNQASKELRELDLKIQGLNWNTELIEK